MDVVELRPEPSQYAWAFGGTLYKLHRASVKADLRTAKILERLGVEDVSDDEVEAALDEE